MSLRFITKLYVAMDPLLVVCHLKGVYGITMFKYMNLLKLMTNLLKIILVLVR
jgi:hypothetical protein